LLSAEIYSYNPIEEESSVETYQKLLELKSLGYVFEIDGYFMLHNKPEMVKERVEGNKRAEALMVKAYKKSKLMGAFPFVRAVMLSGSISKGYVSNDADIDYFIITKPGRLWLARTMLIAYKKLFLFNSYKYFCVNYFIDTSHVAIQERNLFTAMELSTLLPTYGAQHYGPFIDENKWSKKFLPNIQQRPLNLVPESKEKGLKHFFEWTLNNGLGKLLDRMCMRVTLWFWKRKFDHFDDAQFEIALKSRTYVSKHHPHNFQERILKAHQERVDNFEVQTGTDLSTD